VREFVELAGKELGLAIRWEGKGADEKGINIANGKTIVAVDPTYFRPTEVETLLGDPTKAKEKLGWEPEITFEALVREMIHADLEEAKRDELLHRAGFQVSQHNE
jgi:GDPmannose 4,6-dehydratase